MKKVMIFLIALIPLCLIAVLQFSTTMIKESTYIAVDYIKFEENTMTIEKTTLDEVQLSFPAKIYPIDATYSELIYSSTNKDVATVDAFGTITFKKFGMVTILAMLKQDNSVTASCDFIVTDDKPHYVEFVNPQTRLARGAKFKLETKITPNEAINKQLSFTSSDESVATVSPDGTVTGIGEGETIITATTFNGIFASFELDVYNPVEGIYIDDNSKTLTTGKATTKFPDVLFRPADATNKKIYFSSNNEDIAKINDDGEIEFLSAGVSVFTATSEDGEFSCEYTVTYTGGYLISAEIKTQFAHPIEFAENKKIDIEFLLYPIDADMKNISLSSSNPNVIKVEGGQLYIVGGGIATITMTAKKSTTENIQSSVNIRINRNATEIVAEDITISTATAALECLLLPADTTESATFEILNSNLATITDRGIITFKHAGEVFVKITTNKSNISKTIRVSYEPNINYVCINADNQIVTITDAEVGFYLSAELGLGEITEYEYDTNYLIESNGMFRGVKSGAQTIKIKAGDKTITINAEIKIKALDMDLTYNGSEVSRQSFTTSKTELELEATPKPEGHIFTSDVVWESSDEETASVASGVVTFHKAGTVTITATFESISKSVTIISTYGSPTSFDISVTGEVTENGTNSYVFENINREAMISISSFAPSDYEFNISKASFSSSADEIILVDNNGKLTAKSKGTATITIQVGNITKSLQVTINLLSTGAEVSYVNGSSKTKLSTGTVYQVLKETIELEAQVLPMEASNQNAVFSIDSIYSSIAKIVDGNKVKFLQTDKEVIVKATPADGNGEFTEIKFKRVNVKDLSVYYNNTELTTYTIEKQAGDETNVTITVSASASNVLDPETADSSLISARVKSVDEGISIAVQSNETVAGQIEFIATKTKQKKMSAIIAITYGGVDVQEITIVYHNLKSVDIVYYNLDGTNKILKNSEDKNYGMERKRVFGIYARNDTYHGPTWDISYVTDPYNNEDELYWHGNNPTLATFSKGKITVVNTSIVGEQEVTLNISKSSDPNDLSAILASYTFHLVNGINVWNNEDLIYAVGRGLPIVLHTNLGSAAEDKESGILFDELNLESCSFSGKIYGNGRILNFNFMNIDTIGSACEFTGGFTNVYIKGRNYDSTKASYNTYINWLNIVAYSRIENFEIAWLASKSNEIVEVKNCYFRSFSRLGIQMGGYGSGEPESSLQLYLENTIFYDVGKCAIDYQEGSLYIKGIFDVYNFREPTELSFSANIGSNTIKNVFKENVGTYVETWQVEESWIFGTRKVDKYAGNSAICISPSSIVSKPKRDTVYFWDENKEGGAGYIGNVDNCTGFGYTKLVVKISSVCEVYLYIPPLNDKITRLSVPTNDVIEKLNRVI